MRVADLGLDSRIVEILKKQGIEELYPPQAEAIGPALLGENLVLAIPTASGKSLVAYLAILASVLRGGKALYIVPLRALAAEKYEDLKEFEPLGLKVGISVGDYDSVDPNLERLDVIVATSERADSLLRHKTNWLQRLSVVVADEVHLINDADRGPTLEVTLAKLRQVNPGAQVLALSATIKNSEELARWLEAEHIKSEWRPVPLKQGVYHDGLVHFADQTVQGVHVEEDDLSGLVTDIMSSGGQALVFVNTRRSAEALARSLARDVREKLADKDLEHLGKVAASMIREQDEATSVAARLGKCIEGGTAFHHAGLTNSQRSVVEKEFRKGRIRGLVATPTLCLHPDTLITTDRGPVKIALIRQGDRVLTHRGRFRTVLSVSKRWYEGPMLKVKADGMPPVVMTPRHRVLRNDRYRFGHHGIDGVWHVTIRGPLEWVRASELRREDEVMSPVEMPEFFADGGHRTVLIHQENFVGRNQFGSVFSHPTARPVPQTVELEEETAELFGLYAAEGFTSRNGVVGFAIATYESDLTRFLRRTLPTLFKVVVRVSDASRHRRQVTCCSKALAHFFDEEFGRRAPNKHFPEYLIDAPDNIIRALVRGAWKGDGTVDPRGFQKARFDTVSPQLAEQISRMLKRLGYMPAVRITRPQTGLGKHTQYHLALSGTHGSMFLRDVMGINPRQISKGNRTYNTKNLVDGSFRSPVRRIRRVPYAGEVYNLHVEGDESYVCSFAFAVHNSAGINLPARLVIVRDPNRFDVNLGTGHVGSEEELFAFFNRTFFAFTGDVHAIRGKILEVLEFLAKEDFISRHDGFLRATFFGKRTSDLYIDPLSAVKMRDALREARDDRFFHLWTVCTTPDMPKLYLRRGDYAWVEQKIEEADLTFPVEDYDFFLAEVKTASLLDDWITERTEEEVTKKFGIGPGDIRRMTDQAEWLLYSMGELGRIFNKKKVRALTRLTIQVQYGVKEELLELISLRGVGRVRGRGLFQRGFKTLKDLQKANPNDLARTAGAGRRDDSGPLRFHGGPAVPFCPATSRGRDSNRGHPGRHSGTRRRGLGRRLDRGAPEALWLGARRHRPRAEEEIAQGTRLHEASAFHGSTRSPERPRAGESRPPRCVEVTAAARI